jgi:zinc protease
MFKTKSLVSLQYCPSSIRQVGVLFLVTVVCGLMGRSAAGEPPAPKKVATVEGITEYQLTTACAAALPGQFAVKVSVNMTVLVGSRQEGYGETGMAHLPNTWSSGRPHTNVPGSTSTARSGTQHVVDRVIISRPWPRRETSSSPSAEADRFVHSLIRKEDLIRDGRAQRFERGGTHRGRS